MKFKELLLITIIIVSLCLINTNEVTMKTDNIINLKMEGDSMLPSIKEGDIGYAIFVDNNTELKIGDIIVYKAYSYNSPNTGKISHRIMDIKDGKYYLKGDNAKFIEKIDRERIIYKLVGISYS